MAKVTNTKLKVYFRNADGKYSDAPFLPEQQAIVAAVNAATREPKTPWVTICNLWDQAVLHLVDGAIADIDPSFPEELKPLISKLPNRVGEANICPQCERFYFPAKKYGDPTATAEEAEQHMSKVCSTKCWKEFLGAPEEDEPEGVIEVVTPPEPPPPRDERDQT